MTVFLSKLLMRTIVIHKQMAFPKNCEIALFKKRCCNLNKDLDALLGVQYKIVLASEKVYDCRWGNNTGQKNLQCIMYNCREHCMLLSA